MIEISNPVSIIMTTRQTGGLLCGYKPLLLAASQGASYCNYIHWPVYVTIAPITFMAIRYINFRLNYR